MENEEMKGYAGSPFLSGKNFRIGDQVKVAVVEYQGFQEFVDANGVGKSSPIYKVETDKKEAYLFRLSKTNTAFLVSKGYTEWKAVVGKKLTLVVTQTNKGNSLQLINVE